MGVARSGLWAPDSARKPEISVRNQMERTPFGSLLPGGIFGTTTEGDPL